MEINQSKMEKKIQNGLDKPNSSAMQNDLDSERVKRRDSEMQLQLSEDRYRKIIDAIKDYAIFMLDSEGRVSSWNSGAEKIKGYKAHEIIGSHFSKFYPQEAIDIGFPDYELKMARETGRFEDEGIRIRKDGSKFFANIVLSPIFDNDDKVIGYSKITRDVTEKKEAEEKLRSLNDELEIRVAARTKELARRETELRLITDSLDTAIVYIDKDRKFTFVNQAFSSWWNLKKEDIIGKTVAEIFDREPDNMRLSRLEQALRGEAQFFEAEYSYNGKIRHVAVTHVLDLGPDGSVLGFIRILNDITVQRNTEVQLRKAKELAEAANQSKSTFLANMSHEIRTPLGAVLGFADLLINLEENSCEKQNCVDAIKRNGELLGQIINDILDLSKIEAGRLEVERLDVPLAEILNDISAILSLQASEKGIKLSIRAEGSVPEIIKTDPLRLKQILINIIGNAIKFTSKGMVEVLIKQTSSSNTPSKLSFIVKDTGTGISAEQSKRLFQPFMQADSTTTRRFGGTGLGLALSRSLANTLGGNIELLESEFGVGSTFAVTIDPGQVNKVFFDPEATSRRQVRADHSMVAENNLLSGFKILLVDDSSDNRHLIGRILSMAGAKVDCVENGREGIEQANSNKYDVILLDIQMPVMDGYEAIKLLRDHGHKEPIVAMTAHAMKEERDRCFQAGFTEHITKPIDRRFLVQRIKELVPREKIEPAIH